jgi:Zn-dependent peptidase ImmA (M78 family)
MAIAEADRIWTLYGFRTPDELDVDDLAFAMGVVVLDGPLDGADARLIRSGSRGLIRVRNSIANSGQRRFAVGHELGHWTLHAGVSQIVACTSEDMVASYRGSAPEREASVFSSALLMPRALFAARMRRASFSCKTIQSLADFFRTSFTATAIRFVDLSKDYCAMVVSEQGRVCWWQASEPFRGRYRFEAHAAVPDDSVAASLFAGGLQPAEPQEVPAASWLEADADDDSIKGDILEDAFHLKTYGKVISLLSFP